MSQWGNHAEGYSTRMRTRGGKKGSEKNRKTKKTEAGLFKMAFEQKIIMLDRPFRT